ncbi:hypothetical protein CHU98_g2920 [Xylaria longipes]|nr:hypothetical protein CHU98_g2920 [Xylaria longipes]
MNRVGELNRRVVDEKRLFDNQDCDHIDWSLLAQLTELHIDVAPQHGCTTNTTQPNRPSLITMPVPFEALIPCLVRRAQDCLNSDTGRTATSDPAGPWINGIDKVRPTSEEFTSAVETDITGSLVMDRDRRLTGLLRGQSDEPLAPAGFELNNPWRIEKRIA